MINLSLSKDKTKANWLRYIRLDQTGNPYNLLKIVIDKKPYVVTARYIPKGSELILKSEEPQSIKLLYASSKRDKNTCKCDQCDVTFGQPLYLRVSSGVLFYYLTF